LGELGQGFVRIAGGVHRGEEGDAGPKQGLGEICRTSRHGVPVIRHRAHPGRPNRLVADPARYLLEPGDTFQQAERGLRMSQVYVALLRGQFSTGSSPVQDVARDGDAADLAEHRRQRELPVLDAENGRRAVDHGLYSLGSGESLRAGHRQELGQDADRPAQREFEKLPLGTDQPVLLQGCGQGKFEISRGAWLGQEAKQLAFVHRRDRGFQVRLTAE
jgi:hypothetical protein